MGIEYPDAIDMFVPEGNVFIGAKPRGCIIIHKTAGFDTAQEVARYFSDVDGDNPDRDSSHFVVGLDGVVVQCVSLNDGAAANCCLTRGYDKYFNQYLGLYPGNNMNYCTISIEHVDNHKNSAGVYDNQGTPTPLQLEASFKLCLWLRDNYDMQWPDVRGHHHIDPVNRPYCPGNYPLDLLVATMKGDASLSQFIPTLDS